MQRNLKCVYIQEKKGEKKNKKLKSKLVGTVLCAIPKYIFKNIEFL